MSIVPINIGGQANDGNGQTLRSGGALINANFAELDTRTATAQEAAEQGVADAATALDAAVTAQAKADEAVPGSAVGVTVAQLVEGLVPASQLPSYVDDVLEYPTLVDFPLEGETGKIYIAINDGDSPSNPTRQYRWSGTAYVMIPSSPGSTDQVPEGSINLYHTAARVRATALTGLSTSLNEAVVATDSVLSGIGKLQAQISAAVTALAGKLDKSGGKLTGALNHANIVALASSATPAIGAAAANTVTITGTAAITGFDSIASGAVRTLVFAEAVTLTHNATSLILPKGADITTAAGDVLQFTSLGGGNWRCTGKMLATEGGAATGGIYVGVKLPWSLSEASIPGGTLPDNGQLVDRATWPELWALVSGQAISDGTWIADPLQRGKFSTGNGTTTFRMPDTNGKHSDGLTPAAGVLRGHGKNSAGTPGAFQIDQMQGFTFGRGAYKLNFYDGQFPAPNATDAGRRAAYFSNTLLGGLDYWAAQISDGANGTPRVGTESRATNVTVVWITVGATGVSNPGSVDVTALATNVNALSTQKMNIADAPFTRYYESAPTAWVAGGLMVFTHGLGIKPRMVQICGVLTVATANNPVGTIFSVAPYLDGGNYRGGMVIGESTTQVQIRMAVTGVVQLLNATAAEAANPSNSQVFVRVAA